MSVDHTTLNQTIEYALASGIQYITFLVGSWSQGPGHYDVNNESWPGGAPTLQAAVAQIHSRGLKAGMHTLSSNIAKTDRYVTPTPDPRLAKTHNLTLAADINATTAWIPIVQNVSGLPVPYADLERTRRRRRRRR